MYGAYLRSTIAVMICNNCWPAMAARHDAVCMLECTVRDAVVVYAFDSADTAQSSAARKASLNVNKHSFATASSVDLAPGCFYDCRTLLHSASGNYQYYVMMALMADAGRQLTAGVETIKVQGQQLQRQSSSESMDSSLELALPQLCLTITPQEMIASIGRLEGRGSFRDTDGSIKGALSSSKAAKSKGVLHKERRPLPYFAVDCRPSSQCRVACVTVYLSQLRDVNSSSHSTDHTPFAFSPLSSDDHSQLACLVVVKGRFPTAYHMDPNAMEDPEQYPLPWTLLSSEGIAVQ
eukprot:20185-Heterococcus_DN1.PRE.6